MSLFTDIILLTVAWILYVSVNVGRTLWVLLFSNNLGSQYEWCRTCSDHTWQGHVKSSDIRLAAVPRARFVRVLKEPVHFQTGVSTELHQHTCFIPAPSVYGLPASCVINTVPVTCWRSNCRSQKVHDFVYSYEENRNAYVFTETPLEMIDSKTTPGVIDDNQAKHVANEPVDGGASSPSNPLLAGVNPVFRRVFEKYGNAESDVTLTFSDNTDSYSGERVFSQICWAASPKSPFGMPEDRIMPLPHPAPLAKPKEPEVPFEPSTRRFGRFRRCRSCAVSSERMLSEGKAGIQAKINLRAFNVASEESDEARQYQRRWGVPDPRKKEEKWFVEHQT